MSNQIEIAKLHHEISEMRARLFQTEAQLERLRAAKQALVSEQATLHDHKKWGSEPELDHDAWRGQAESTHDDIRRHMQLAYTNVQDETEQLMRAIEIETSRLQTSIASCQIVIDTNQQSLQTLKAAK
ncbi:DUF5082 domain-containing protein [Shouchella clausii]|uniref:DUF5082 domain-containing protein n=1 Tax=Shouchella clausii TaxID=79880 RepID=UPI000BA6272C|nr:DUF5082 domain-containing protein [Shouchella clausii]MBU8597000.1 DUF5082 domain-containing protein [Shouchella clausii]MCY1104488.1 DUF5082 domain-containing protein [Shouchella clausii]MED4157217.1 DUF5082 domain-containing protein [Shouchella clausii]MED4178857.1 DUF5082 domain-containing protein [Shouchella clausii]PAD08800.1 DUF5082 domain-containing protein [Shouchella clausii]